MHIHFNADWRRPACSQTRNLPPGLSLRSPALRPTHEVHQEELPDDVDIEFLSLDDNDLRYDEPSAYGDDDLDTIDERGSDKDADEGDDDDDDDMADWPDTSSGTSAADEAVHIEGLPRSEIRLEAR